MSARILAAVVGLTLLVLAVHDIPLARHLHDVERHRLVTTLERDAFTIAGIVADDLEAGDDAAAARVDRLVDGYGERVGGRVVVVGADGLALASTDPDGGVGRDFSTRPEIEAALGGSFASGTRFSETLGYDLVYVAVPVLSGRQPIGAVRLTFPASEIDERADDRLVGLVLVALISLVLATGVGLALARGLSKPIRSVERTTVRLAEGDLRARAPADDGPAEVRNLAVSVNTMAGRLETLIDTQRAFTGDASHQLRTPLTSLRLRLETAADQLDAGGDPAAARVGIEAALDETYRLQRIVEGLLLLARTEGPTLPSATDDLAVTVRDRLAAWEPLADERSVTLTSEAPPSAVVRAVEGAPAQIIDNYLDNALDHAPPGTRIRLLVEPDGDEWVLHVIDEGRGLSDDDRQRAFDRFWRAPGQERPGSGLGLAIVRQLAAASGGTVELRAAPTGGVDAIARFARA